MKILQILIITAGSALFFTACNKGTSQFDASGSFEAEETIISAEAAGVIKAFEIEEGQGLKAGQAIGFIDSTQLYLKKKQLQAQIKAMLSRKPNIGLQLAPLNEQLANAENEKKRIIKLIEGSAATTKQLDDVNTAIEVIKRQISAQRSSLEISSESIIKETEPLKVQVQQLNDQLRKCRIINPMNGTVLVKYAEANEMTAQGKPLYKIADLSNIILRVYISGDQMAQVKLNEQVTVSTDNGNGGYNTTEGSIIWISDKAEFTPKTIQTKNERANMVYAIKVKVANEGSYKIGMYGEIKFQ